MVLLNERELLIDAKGTRTERRRYAVKVLTSAGRPYAQAAEFYVRKDGKVLDLHAFLVQPNGTERVYGKDRVADEASASYELYSDQRVRTVSAQTEAEPGSVFGFESTSRETSVHTTDAFWFQRSIPVLKSRFRLVLPPSWEYRARMKNAAAQEPRTEGGALVWEMSGLPAIEDEPLSPEFTTRAAAVLISLFPPEGQELVSRGLRTWEDVSRFLHGFEQSQVVADEAIRAKVAELTKGAGGEWETIQRLGRYVQGTQYVAVNRNLNRGGGYRPNPAPEVFRKNYGDCKDKATLLKTMLEVVGIRSWVVTINAGDRTSVVTDWPTPSFFDHAILAIALRQPLGKPAETTVEGFGRLLIFDPTAASVPVGEVPAREQGSWALLDAESGGKLFQVPVSGPEQNLVKRRIEVRLKPDGGASGSLEERFAGRLAASQRMVRSSEAASEFQDRVRAWASRSMAGVVTQGIEANEDPDAGAFGLKLVFETAQYAKAVGTKLWSVRPTALVRDVLPALAKTARQSPVQLMPLAVDEDTELQVPEGLEVDELPDAGTVTTPYGSLMCAYQVEGGKVVVKRRLRIAYRDVPAEEYGKLKAFLDLVRAQDHSVVMLKRRAE